VPPRNTNAPRYPTLQPRVEIGRITGATLLCCHSYHLRRLTHLWLKLLEFVLTWRYCRHEGALCYRSLGLEEATAVTRDTVVQDGTQGMYHILVLYRRLLVCYNGSPCCPFRLCHRPSALSSLVFLTARSHGEAGKSSTGRTRADLHRTLHAASAPLAVVPCDTSIPFPRLVYQQGPCMPHFAPCISTCTCRFPPVLTTFCRSTMLSLLEATSRTTRRHCRLELRGSIALRCCTSALSANNDRVCTNHAPGR
jgi:hypothetical protein